MTNKKIITDSDLDVVGVIRPSRIITMIVFNDIGNQINSDYERRCFKCKGFNTRQEHFPSHYEYEAGLDYIICNDCDAANKLTLT